MDTSKEFIEMCRKSVEIQENWEPERGDFMNWPKTEGYNIWHNAYYFKCPKEYGYKWLPRQDQLQEMLGEFLINTLLEFSKWFINPYLKYDGAKKDGTFKTPEQFWIVFVMKEKFNKTWNGEEWEND